MDYLDIQSSHFYELLNQHLECMDIRKKDGFCITQEKYEKIVECLRTESKKKCQFGAKMKHWSKSHYKLKETGTRHLVYCKKTDRPLVTKGELFLTIDRCHRTVGHSGRDKTWQKVKSQFAGVKWDAIDLYLKTCLSCSKRQPVKHTLASKPMISLQFLQRVQIDLIDFRSRPDGDFCWILHARDYFTKFSWTYPMKTNSAVEVAEHLFSQFCIFGPPKLLQSEHGREFTTSVITEVSNIWPELNVINGRPRHPKTQGCVERGNSDLQLRLEKWMDDNGTNWSQGLKIVTSAMNTTVSLVTGTSPYQLVFGPNVQCDSALWDELARQGITNEEDLPFELIDQIELTLPTSSESNSEFSISYSGFENVVQVSKHEPNYAQNLLSADCVSTSYLMTEDVPSSSTTDPIVQIASPTGDSGHQTNNSKLLMENSNENPLTDTQPPTNDKDTDNLATMVDLKADTISAYSNQTYETTKYFSCESSPLHSSKSRKRGREYTLLSGTNIIATGEEQLHRDVIRGKTINLKSHAILSVVNVLDDTFVPTEGNPTQEPIYEGQFVLWNRKDLVKNEDEDDDSIKHKSQRMVERKNHIRDVKGQTSSLSCRKQVKNFQKCYTTGDVVGGNTSLC